MQAQQNPQWTQYVLNQYAINPAYAGLDRSLSVTAGLRSQWSKFDGSPKTQVVNAHLPLYYLNGSAGIMMLNEELGAFKRTQVTASYNYIFSSSIGLFSAGFRFGLQNISLNNRAIVTPQGVYIDNAIDHQDPRLNNANLSGMAPLWSFGLYYTKESLEIGLSIDNPANNTEAGNSTFNEKTAFSLFGAYQFYLNEILVLEPNILLKTDGTQTQLDIGVLGHYEQFLGGLSLRGYNANSIDAIGVIAGVRVSNNVRVSYSFDLGLSTLSEFHDGTHEFLINYNLNKPIRTGELPRIIYNPRYN